MTKRGRERGSWSGFHWDVLERDIVVQLDNIDLSIHNVWMLLVLEVGHSQLVKLLIKACEHDLSLVEVTVA